MIEKCPEENRQNCPAWEFQSGDLCWFINGTICHGEVQEKWSEKMEMCRKCKVLKPVLTTHVVRLKLFRLKAEGVRKARLPYFGGNI